MSRLSYFFGHWHLCRSRNPCGSGSPSVAVTAVWKAVFLSSALVILEEGLQYINIFYIDSHLYHMHIFFSGGNNKLNTSSSVMGNFLLFIILFAYVTVVPNKLNTSNYIYIHVYCT